MHWLSLRNMLLALGLYAGVVPTSAAGDAGDGNGAGVDILIHTDAGTIEARLDAAAAPATVENFLEYARSGFYTGTIFHRVIPGFMIQGGGLTKDMARRTTGAPVRNESTNGLSNVRGSLAMARTNDPDSATSQFFINLVDNTQLDGRTGRPGYTVFGRVTGGMDVVDRIAAVKTTRRAGHRDVPTESIAITGVEILATTGNGDDAP